MPLRYPLHLPILSSIFLSPFLSSYLFLLVISCWYRDISIFFWFLIPSSVFPFSHVVLLERTSKEREKENMYRQSERCVSVVSLFIFFLSPSFILFPAFAQLIASLVCLSSRKRNKDISPSHILRARNYFRLHFYA